MEERIRRKLEEIGENYDLLKENTKKYLQRIETIICQKESEIAEASNLLKKQPYSPASISKELQCSRTTLYNNNRLLQRYIELSLKETNRLNANKEIERLRKVIAEKDAALKLMQARDVNEIKLKLENKKLHNLIKGKNREIEKLRAQLYTDNNVFKKEHK